MGLGSTAKKIQLVAEKAEQVFEMSKDLKERVTGLEAATEETHEQVAEVREATAENRALLEAIAAEQGLDVEEILTEDAPVDNSEGNSEGDEQA